MGHVSLLKCSFVQAQPAICRTGLSEIQIKQVISDLCSRHHHNQTPDRRKPWDFLRFEGKPFALPYKRHHIRILSSSAVEPVLLSQHVITICINKLGMDTALAKETAIGSAGAGPVPDPCRSPGAEIDSGTFLSEVSSHALAARAALGTALSQALGQLCLLYRRTAPAARAQAWPWCITRCGDSTRQLGSLQTNKPARKPQRQ